MNVFLHACLQAIPEYDTRPPQHWGIISTISDFAESQTTSEVSQDGPLHKAKARKRQSQQDSGSNTTANVTDRSGFRIIPYIPDAQASVEFLSSNRTANVTDQSGFRIIPYNPDAAGSVELLMKEGSF
jgi:hypothetical protein